MSNLKFSDGLPIELDDGRIVRYSKLSHSFEELVDGEWKEPSEPVLWADVRESISPPTWD